MLNRFIREHLLCSYLVFTFAALLLAACNNSSVPAMISSSKLTRANFDQIHEGASKEQVQAILGQPTTTDVSDKVIYERTTWRYTEGDKYINLTFKNDKLDSKDTNLGAS